MTDAHSIKKLKPTATVAMPESRKDLGIIKCYACGADVWPKHGKWIGCFDVEKNVHVCAYCKFLERQKQDLLEKGKTVKSFCDNEEEKGLVHASAGLAKGESVKDIIRDLSSDEEEFARKCEATAAIIDLQQASTKETVLLERTRFELLNGRDFWMCTVCAIEMPSLTAPCGGCRKMIPFVPLEVGEFEEFVRKQREKGVLVKLGPVHEKEVPV